MLRYISRNGNFDLRINGQMQNYVYFRLESISAVSMKEDGHGIYSFTVILNNATTIDFTRTNKNESMELVSKMFNNIDSSIWSNE